MSEARGREAKTVLRLLEFCPQKMGFQRNEENPLKCDLLVIDEASMIDTVLMYQLLKAVSVDATLILWGDVYLVGRREPASICRTAERLERHHRFQCRADSDID